MQLDVENDLNATNYTGLNLSEIKHSTYEELKSSMNNMNAVDDDITDQGNHSVYEVAAVSDHLEPASNRRNQTAAVVPLTKHFYVNLQRPVKSLNLNV